VGIKRDGKWKGTEDFIDGSLSGTDCEDLLPRDFRTRNHAGDHALFEGMERTCMNPGRSGFEQNHFWTDPIIARLI
jgi:hypothetical protein